MLVSRFFSIASLTNHLVEATLVGFCDEDKPVQVVSDDDTAEGCFAQFFICNEVVNSSATEVVFHPMPFNIMYAQESTSIVAEDLQK